MVVKTSLLKFRKKFGAASILILTLAAATKLSRQILDFDWLTAVIYKILARITQLFTNFRPELTF